jgi:hypothetical protein
MSTILDEDLIPKEEQRTFRPLIVIIWGMFLALGAFLRLMHWPGSSILILASSAGLTAYAFSGFLTLKGKDIINLIYCILGAAWMIILVLCLFLNDGHPYNANGVALYGGILILWLIIYELQKRRKMRTNRK